MLVLLLLPTEIKSLDQMYKIENPAEERKKKEDTKFEKTSYWRREAKGTDTALFEYLNVGCTLDLHCGGANQRNANKISRNQK